MSDRPQLQQDLLKGFTDQLAAEQRITNNLELYKYLYNLPAEQQQSEYARLAPQCKFKVKSLGWLLQKGAEFDALAGQAK